MFQIGWLGVFGAGLAGFAIGGLWYGPLFGKAWQREAGLSDEAIKGANMPLIFGTTFLLNLIAAFVLSRGLALHDRPDVAASAMLGAVIGLAFIGTSIGVSYLFSRKSLRLFLIDAGYWAIAYTAMGAILAVLG